MLSGLRVGRSSKQIWNRNYNKRRFISLWLYNITKSEKFEWKPKLFIFWVFQSHKYSHFCFPLHSIGFVSKRLSFGTNPSACILRFSSIFNTFILQFFLYLNIILPKIFFFSPVSLASLEYFLDLNIFLPELRYSKKTRAKFDRSKLAIWQKMNFHRL